MTQIKLISPHGGKLVNREPTGLERDQLIRAAAEMPSLNLTAREVSDLELIAYGAYSPLEGFLDSSNYLAVVHNMRLASGLPWTIPITLSVSNQQASELRGQSDVALYQADHLLAVLHLAETFT